MSCRTKSLRAASRSSKSSATRRRTSPTRTFSPSSPTPTTTDEAEVDGYKLMWFAVHTSNMTTSTSVVRLELDGQQFEAVCSGDGPVDAAFEAIDQIIRPVEHSFDLYRINSISPGKDTMGDVSVKLSCDNRTFSGRGLHTNIVEASVRAYISAMNKLRAYAARRAKGEV